MPPLGNPWAISYSRSSARSDLKTFTFPLAPYNFRMRAICDESDMRTLLRLMLMAHSIATAAIAVIRCEGHDRRPLRPGLKHHAEPRLPAHHAVVSLWSLIQRVRLYQRLHSGERAEPQRILGVDRGPAGPARYYLPRENQRQHGHLYRLQRRTDDHEPPSIPEPANRRRHSVRVRHRRQDGSGTTQLLQCLRHVFLRAVDVVLGAQLAREVGIVLTTSDGNGVEAHLRRELNPEMPEPA